MSELVSTVTAAGVELLQCAPLRDRGVPHGFTLKTNSFGARSSGGADRRKLSEALGLEGIATMRQVHGNDVRPVESSARFPVCDGLVTDRPGLGLVVQAADCVPLLLWASSRNTVAAVHAGWRGTLARIASRTIAALEDLGASPSEIHCAIGPSIRLCCFEVGDEVMDAFAETGRRVEGISRPGPRGRRHLDLVQDNRDQLVQAGVPPAQIYDLERCTACEVERFYSYRREGKGVGRLMGVVAIRPL